ncbi:MAG: tyrosine-type recombinase/integrase [Deltaproteobacteria bacterium]|nr:tyrosine-type recombinase/integrase [Deltaproteobacteria bacterium]
MRRAGLAGHTPKDLRDTFASWLVSIGAPVAWVSESLGHSNWAVTAQHYAQWMEDSAGRQFTPKLDSGDVWPDLLARVGATITPESPPNAFQPQSIRGGELTANSPLQLR